MTLPIIQSLWIGAPFSNLEKLCVQSFLDHGHEFHLYTYDQIDGIPTGATIKDGNEILLQSKIFHQPQFRSSIAAFADWFRWALLAQKGGWWVDMDIACLRPFDFTEEIIFSHEGTQIANGILKFPQGHPFPTQMEKHCRDYPDKEQSKWGRMGGPIGFTERMPKDLARHAKSSTYFLPIPWEYWYTAFDTTFADDIAFFKTTHAIHFANNLIIVDKNARFDSVSLFEQLKSRHKIANSPNAETISSTQLHALVKADHAKQIQQTAQNRKRKIKRKRTLFALIAFVLGIACGILIYMTSNA